MEFADELSKWYPNQVGKLITHLHAVEYALRGRLSYHDAKVDGRPAADLRLRDVQVGDRLAVNSTSYESLRQLIEKYNSSLPTEDADLELDPTIAELRDAFAHGRIVPLEDEKTIRLVKFGRPQDGQVTVEFAQTLELRWLHESSAFALRQNS